MVGTAGNNVLIDGILLLFIIYIAPLTMIQVLLFEGDEIVVLSLYID